MNNFKKLAVATALYACVSGAAMAADTDWSGFYLGANAGEASGSSDVTTTTVFSPTGYFATTSVPAIGIAGEGNVSPDGFTYGVTAGFNLQSGSWVYGLEADYNELDGDDSRSVTATYPCCAPTAFTVDETTKTGEMYTVRGRLGYANGNSLFYVTAGWAEAKIKIDDQFNDTFATAHEDFSGSESKGDWIYGVGFEYGFNDCWSMKIEYLYADFGEVTGTSDNLTAFSPAIAYPTNTFTHTADLQLDVLRIGFNYRF